jgi:hypothetical protein
MMNNTSIPTPRFSDLLSDDALALMKASGKQLIKRIGVDVVRSVVLDVLTGRNIRNSTEILTRRRIAALNLAMLQLFLNGSQLVDNFVERLPYLASDTLTAEHVDKSERWLALWILGLTGKGVQNVLRDDYQELGGYRESYIEACQQLISQNAESYGELFGEIKLGDQAKIQINWLFMLYLMNTIGSQTLTIRGSDKSTYGKMFEKLVLGSVLHMLGFQFRNSGDMGEAKSSFWLSSRGDKRESDATLLYDVGKGVRFDIGFIGKGNSEISLDKVSRFRKEVEMGRKTWYMATIIIVDRLGERSKTEQLAREIDGTIVQMSAGYWPQRVARILNETVGFEHPLVMMDKADVGEYIRTQMQNVPLETFIELI